MVNGNFKAEKSQNAEGLAAVILFSCWKNNNVFFC